MCSRKVIDFARDCVQLNRADHPVRVIEIGSYNVNGSVRDVFSTVPVMEYIGTDMRSGPGVDRVISFDRLLPAYGYDSFDWVVCTETAEHVRDWRSLVSTIKGLVRPGGWVIFTVPSRGFPRHDYPGDFWRYELEDVCKIFRDMEFPDVRVEPTGPGVFCCVRKPENFGESDLSDIELHSVSEEG